MRHIISLYVGFSILLLGGNLMAQTYQLLIPKQEVVAVAQDAGDVLYYLDKGGNLYRHNSILESRVEDIPSFTHLVMEGDNLYAVAKGNIWIKSRDNIWKAFLKWDKEEITHIFAGNASGELLVVTKDAYYKISGGSINACPDSRNPGVITSEKRVKAVQIENSWYILDKGIVRKICNSSKTIATDKYIIDLTTKDGKLALISENDGPYILDNNGVRPVLIPGDVLFPNAVFGRFYKNYYLNLTSFNVKRYSLTSAEVTETSMSEFYPQFQDSRGRIFGYDQIGVGYIATVETKQSPKFGFTEMTIDDESIEGLSSYELTKPTSRMRISAESVDWYSSNPAKYYYRLPPKYADWEEWNIISPLLLDLDQNTQVLEMKSIYEGKEIELLEGPFPIRTKPKENNAVWYILIGSLLLLVIGGLIANLRLNRVKKAHSERISRISLQKQYAEEQLKSLQLQMNPHFLFNVLNSIQGLIALGEHKLARQNLNRFAQLMRGTLYQSTEDHVTIASEIELLNQYLILEQLCRPDKFDYDIFVSSSIDQEAKIPSMLIQPFVENSILHGIRWKKTKGTIKLAIAPHSSGILCTVSDNGVGRKVAGEKKEENHKSVGLEIVTNRLKKYFRFKPHLKTIQYEDLVDTDGSSLGTKVEVLLPILS